MARRWWTLVAVCGATFMLLVDVTIVQVALPQLQRDLHASLSDLQWVINAYALALAALILTSGAVADLIGRKRVFVFGIAIFTASSALCGVAGSVGVLIAARAIQGIGGAAMFATSLALIGQEFSGRERASAIAAWGATVGGAVAIGPLVGGLVTDALGWQWIFFVNVPIGVAALALAQALIVNRSDPAAAGLDVGGLICFSGGLFALIFALQRGNAAGWGSTEVVGVLIAAAVLMALFVVIELRQAHAMFDFELFRKPAFCGVSIATFAIGAGMFSQLVFLALYLQDVLGYSPLAGGIRMLPLTALVFIVPLGARSLATKVPQRVVLGAGMALVALGLLLMHGIGPGSSWTHLLPGMLLTGAGIGFANPAIATTALGVVAPTRSGMASGISNTFRLGGLATGISALGAIFTQRIGTELSLRLPHASHGLASLVAAGGVRAAAAATATAERAHTVAAARLAFLAGFNEILLAGAAITLVGAICAVVLIRAQDFERAGARDDGHEPARAARDPAVA
ncbi:MAG TPA: MFS transporter [Solirubrobacteraceae bacterium]|jgi:EmrB/QacA subfamily drug resistance transporter